MVREAFSSRHSPIRAKRQLLRLGGLGVLALICILALGREASQQHDLASGVQHSSTEHAYAGIRSSQQSRLLPRALSATRSTLGAAFTSSTPACQSKRAVDNITEATLVVYCYNSEDHFHESNFRYFVRWGLVDTPGIDYLFIVSNKNKEQALPPLPGNARYWDTALPDCVYGLGIVGKALEAGQVDRDKHKYYVLTGSYVRGPFLPTFLQDQQHWTDYLLRRLRGATKLVGPTISCQDPESGLNTTDGHAAVPYVQFLVMATDAAGLALMDKEKSVFACYNNTQSARFWSERGAPRAVIKAGHTLDSLMVRYRGVDWQNQSNWGCNARHDPLMEWRYDGISVNPFEIMFVPMDLVVVENGYTYAKQAAVYDAWLSLQDADRSDISSNVWEHDAMAIKRQRMAYVQSRGPGCFDTNYYLSKNPDLFVIPTPLQLWDHFVSNGQFEGRSFRWSCDDDRRLPWE